jgi:hypothetical protein
MAKKKPDRSKPPAEDSLISKWDIGDRMRRELLEGFPDRKVIEAGRASAAEVPNIIAHFQKMTLAAMEGETDLVSEDQLRALARALDDLRNRCRGIV